MINGVAAAALVAGVGFFAGAMNSVAGGGSFVAFPTLVFLGLPPIVANATNNTAMWVGTVGAIQGFRQELAADVRKLVVPAIVALVGGLVGAVVLLKTPEQVFGRLIPWLLLGATILFASSGWLRRFSGDAEHAGIFHPKVLPGLFFVAVYGGYFGAGIGILNLALLSLSGIKNVHRANALKSALGFGINGMAVIPFMIVHKIVWSYAAIMAVGSVLGGYASARISQRLSQTLVRRIVIAIGAGMSAYFFATTR